MKFILFSGIRSELFHSFSVSIMARQGPANRLWGVLASWQYQHKRASQAFLTLEGLTSPLKPLDELSERSRAFGVVDAPQAPVREAMVALFTQE
ncbi:hypothetical protein [Pseudomonas arsenicoxydans]|uniref:hypothetical protein n=1 Tax=Pseudomonas arsenicoxydans TaxID=702115 RepID=UPI0012FE4AAC|nr:hypothetical protein [Pseudomonas arsenicoxydans]